MNVLLYEATFPRLTISKLLPTLSAGFRKISADRCDPRVCVYIYIFVWNLCLDHTCKKREIPEIYLRNFFWIFEINTAPKPSPEVPSQMEVTPSQMKVAPFQMEVAPFFVGFHNLRSFVAIYIMSRFTHFFRNFFLAKIAFSATSHVFCMYVSKLGGPFQFQKQ